MRVTHSSNFVGGDFGRISDESPLLLVHNTSREFILKYKPHRSIWWSIVRPSRSVFAIESNESIPSHTPAGERGRRWWTFGRYTGARWRSEAAEDSVGSGRRRGRRRWRRRARSVDPGARPRWAGRRRSGRPVEDSVEEGRAGRSGEGRAGRSEEAVGRSEEAAPVERSGRRRKAARRRRKAARRRCKARVRTGTRGAADSARIAGINTVAPSVGPRRTRR